MHGQKSCAGLRRSRLSVAAVETPATSACLHTHHTGNVTSMWRGWCLNPFRHLVGANQKSPFQICPENLGDAFRMQSASREPGGVREGWWPRKRFILGLGLGARTGQCPALGPASPRTLSSCWGHKCIRVARGLGDRSWWGDAGGHKPISLSERKVRLQLLRAPSCWRARKGRKAGEWRLNLS